MTSKELRTRIRKAREARRSLRQRVATRSEQIKRLTRRLKKKERKGLPAWLPQEYAQYWKRPWLDAAGESAGFRDLLWKHGYASPHFTEPETRCKRGDRVPESLRRGCQRQAFRLERVRHELGDTTMPVLSWYRPRDYNQQIGGATNSRHIQADASDFDVALVNRIGRARFDAAMEKHYSQDGYGQYPSGSRHSDTRGYRARWSSF